MLGNKNHYAFHQTRLKRATFKENPCVNIQKGRKKLKKQYDLYEELSTRVTLNENPCVKTQKGSRGTLGKPFSRRPTGTN